MKFALYQLRVSSSDMVFNNSSTTVVILQPPNTIGMRNAADLKERAALHHTPWKLTDIFYETIGYLSSPRNFLHFGNLKWGGSQVPIDSERRDPPHGALKGFNYCGGIVTIAEDDYNEIRIECEECGTVATSHIQKHDFPTVLLHLALKQMIPSLSMCNYIACDEYSIGTVAVYNDALGIKEGSCLWKASLGFVLMPGMHIDHGFYMYGFDGFDEWVRFLVQTKFDQLECLSRDNRPALLGPKQDFDSSSMRRKTWLVPRY